MIGETLLHERLDDALALGIDLGEKVLVAELGLGHGGADLLLRGRDKVSYECAEPLNTYYTFINFPASTAAWVAVSKMSFRNLSLTPTTEHLTCDIPPPRSLLGWQNKDKLSSRFDS